MQLSIDQSTLLCRLLADASRQRILLLLEAEALSVAEITQITRLSQGRVSTHLSRLRAAGLVTDERVNNVRHFRANLGDPEDPATGLWQTLRARIDDQQAEFDREKAREAVRRRHAGTSWAETVAGRMERHYSPGRSWEANARALLGLVSLGDVLDIARGLRLPVFGQPAATLTDAPPAVVSAGAPWYLRMTLLDKPGALAKIATLLGESGISIARMRQYSHDGTDAPVLIVTHKASSDDISFALAKFAETGVVVGDPVALRIEEV